MSRLSNYSLFIADHRPRPWRRFLIGLGIVSAPMPDTPEPLGWSRGRGDFYIFPERADGSIGGWCSNSPSLEMAKAQAARRAADPSAGTIAYFVVDRRSDMRFRFPVEGRNPPPE